EEPTAESSGLRRRKGLSTSGLLAGRTPEPEATGPALSCRAHDVRFNQPERMVGKLGAAEAFHSGIVHRVDQLVGLQLAAELAEDIRSESLHMPVGDLEQDAERRCVERIAERVGCD